MLTTGLAAMMLMRLGFGRGVGFFPMLILLAVVGGIIWVFDAALDQRTIERLKRNQSRCVPKPRYASRRDHKERRPRTELNRIQ